MSEGTLLLKTKDLYSAIPELPVVYRFLAQEDLTVLKYLLLGPVNEWDSNVISEYQKEKDKIEFMSYYISDIFYETGTDEYEVDTDLTHLDLKVLAESPDYHKNTLLRLSNIVYPALGLPEMSVSITDIYRTFLNPKQVGTDTYTGVDYYAIDFKRLS